MRRPRVSAVSVTTRLVAASPRTQADADRTEEEIGRREREDRERRGGGGDDRHEGKGRMSAAPLGSVGRCLLDRCGIHTAQCTSDQLRSSPSLISPSSEQSTIAAVSQLRSTPLHPLLGSHEQGVRDAESARHALFSGSTARFQRRDRGGSRSARGGKKGGCVLA